jgi:hypothetical protein
MVAVSDGQPRVKNPAGGRPLDPRHDLGDVLADELEVGHFAFPSWSLQLTAFWIISTLS